MKGYNSVIIPATITKEPIIKDEFILHFKVVTTRTVKNRKENTEREEVIPLLIEIEGPEAPGFKTILKEGMKVIIAGSLKLYKYQDAKGFTKSTHIIVADCIHYGHKLIDAKD